ncbi:hypothetical protein RIdsm_04843 [Roseovarius indicus]|uniref:Uncharacterized protein n=1 Tax=Roseovarius indicus TaxID=540747 RepID=A0A5P3AIE7_9RHOB|nr:hypothetical protein RIdsm_04843 [Roseovarius indicus]
MTPLAPHALQDQPGMRLAHFLFQLDRPRQVCGDRHMPGRVADNLGRTAVFAGSRLGCLLRNVGLHLGLFLFDRSEQIGHGQRQERPERSQRQKYQPGQRADQERDRKRDHQDAADHTGPTVERVGPPQRGTKPEHQQTATEHRRHRKVDRLEIDRPYALSDHGHHGNHQSGQHTKRGKRNEAKIGHRRGPHVFTHILGRRHDTPLVFTFWRLNPRPPGLVPRNLTRNPRPWPLGHRHAT